MAKPPDPKHRVVTTNRRALHRYLVLETLEVGLSLVGTEVKSIRGGQISIQEAYVRVKGDELWLVGATIPEYPFGNRLNHEPTRDRKLLAHRREIRRWHKAVREKGVTIVPLEVYFKDSTIKLEIALVRGKKLYDKRAAERARSDRREVDRAMGRRR